MTPPVFISSLAFLTCTKHTDIFFFFFSLTNKLLLIDFDLIRIFSELTCFLFFNHSSFCSLCLLRPFQCEQAYRLIVSQILDAFLLPKMAPWCVMYSLIWAYQIFDL